MKIVLVTGGHVDHPNLSGLAALVGASGVQFETIDRAPGAISVLPCLAALFADGTAAKSGGLELDAQTLQTWAGQSDAKPSPSCGADLTWDEFLDVALATDKAKTRAILINMPEVVEFCRKYINDAGIKYADALPSAEGQQPGRLARLMQSAIDEDHIDQNFVIAFLAKWVELYPNT